MKSRMKLLCMLGAAGFAGIGLVGGQGVGADATDEHGGTGLQKAASDRELSNRGYRQAVDRQGTAVLDASEGGTDVNVAFQGRFVDDIGLPLVDSHDLYFRIFDDLGDQRFSTGPVPVMLINGVATTQIPNVPVDVFDRFTPYRLDVSVDDPSFASAFPVDLTATPFAVKALVANSAMDADTVDGFQAVELIIPTGVIVMWSGSIASIPNGWALCDGTNGTPDLRDKFIVGATEDVDAVASTNVSGILTQNGGLATRSLSAGELPKHTHSSPNHAHSIGSHEHSIGSHSHAVTPHSHSIGTHRHDIAHIHTVELRSGPAGQGVGLSANSQFRVDIHETSGASPSQSGESGGQTGSTGGETSGSGSQQTGSAGATSTSSASGTTGSAGTGKAFSVLNPYYALAYIMKL